ncbi:uncharacterized protein LOC110833907 isoform X5 [Zootermopsis nevadensis]|uniref:uncharacterized protein LOC110833907 isoform X5 n=1 Tax=Zootermopsis nevadensis TaxID=136037 RepID=UPI000B8E2188|nr:uncharacterized protein LOC110833907 isoform X5 [Zootermopsis nevadensis]
MNRCPEHNKDSSVCVCVCVLQCNSILEPELAELTCGIHPSCTKRASWQPTILFFPLLLDSQAFGSLQLAQGIRSLKLLNHEARDVRRALYFGHNRKFASWWLLHSSSPPGFCKPTSSQIMDHLESILTP